MTTDYEVNYRDALATVRAIVARDDVAVSIIAKHATDTLVADMAGVCMFLLTAHLPEPLRAIDALFDTVPETLAAHEAHRRQRDGGGAS